MLTILKSRQSKTHNDKPIVPFKQKLPQLPPLPNMPKRALASAKRLMPRLPFTNKPPQYDMLIIGAGVSGIDMACHIQRNKILSKSIKTGRVTIIEKRDAIGGTWDLFKYPGIRSDSDMTTFGFAHRPWLGKKTLADAESIKQYIVETAEDVGIDSLIQFNTEVSKIEWSSKLKYWTATVLDVKTGKTQQITSRFIIGATGYYDYKEGYQPTFKGQESFKGQIVHPQLWTHDIDYNNKRVVVIGSGATAVTLVPALLDKTVSASNPKGRIAAHVTMLQRSPTYIGSVPSEDNSITLLTERFKLSSDTAYSLIRGKNILFQQGVYKLAKVAPKVLKTVLIRDAKKALKGSVVSVEHFKPDYDPWDQRLCAVPDGDLFKTIHSGRADIVTDSIKCFTPSGIELESGRHLEADLIVTATGLKLQMLGGAKVYIDGDLREVSERMTYKAVMVDGAPNLAVLFGYTNASWTLKIDLACDYITRLLRHMYLNGYSTVVPSPVTEDGEVAVKQSGTVMGSLTAGYIKRAENVLPKQGDRYPWLVTNNYLTDTVMLKYHRIKDKWLRFK
ncbi:NAD(P)/FAD-dependent oxidoreductase [Psychrobacter sp.]|uniref:flavin-containing monooxygenase n=1 Tax=Psychrobacter sp. TaxID=56811 RepID=UPI0025ED1C65|nr:NAD(P)/FAD-dependent oxidoreductase [Psychrobacter sp.]